MKLQIQRIFHNPNCWEDYKNGMYNDSCSNVSKKIAKAIELLSNPKMFEYYANKVIEKWIFSSEHHLSNLQRNRRAWLGQASCCYFAGTPELYTKEAWHQMTDKQRELANAIADKVIRRFERRLVFKYQLDLI